VKVAVVGLGIAGLSICARLALAGHDVAGFEQFDPLHVSGASHGDTRIMRLTPGEAEIYTTLARRAAPMWRDWEGFAGQPLIEWTGGLMAGPRGSPFVAQCQRFSQKPAGLLRGDAIHPLTRGYIAMPYEWDVFRQDDCGVIGADATRAFLLRQTPRWGAKLHHNAKIEAPIEGLTLKINGQSKSFEAIIVAAGAWARRLLPEFAGRLEARRRVVGYFRTDEPRLLPLMCVDNDVGLYGMSAPRGLYKLGLHAVGGAVEPEHIVPPNEEDAALLSEQARLHLPRHDPTPVRMALCHYTVTPDENFLIAPSRFHPRVLLFSACSGHGFKYAPIYGQFAEEWLNEKPSVELEAFSILKRARTTNQFGEHAS